MCAYAKCFFCAGEVCLMSFSLVSGKRTFDEPHAQQIWSKSSWQTALGKCCLRATNCHHTWAMMLPEKSRGGGMDFINDACQICMTTYACVHACTCTYTHVSANYLCVCVRASFISICLADHFKVQKHPQGNSSDRKMVCNHLLGSSNDRSTFLILLVFQNMGNA